MDNKNLHPELYETLKSATTENMKRICRTDKTYYKGFSKLKELDLVNHIIKCNKDYVLEGEQILIAKWNQELYRHEILIINKKDYVKPYNNEDIDDGDIEMDDDYIIYKKNPW